MNADRFWIERGRETWVGWESASGLRFRALNERCVNYAYQFITMDRWGLSDAGFYEYTHVRPSCRLEISLRGVPCEEE